MVNKIGLNHLFLADSSNVVQQFFVTFSKFVFSKSLHLKNKDLIFL
jgi:hypothetical protein